MFYTNSEYVDMLLILGEVGAASVAARVYAERFPARRHPDKNVIERLEQRLRETGQIAPPRSDAGRPRTTRTPQMEELILDTISNAPSASTRGVSRILHVNKSLISRVLRTEGWHPYHLQKVQHLFERDFAPRVEFCNWYQQMVNLDHDFAGKILWTDEAIFTQDGVFNCHNSHFWANENPHAVYQKSHQVRYGFNVWAGIIGSYLIGPLILPNRLNGNDFLEFLENDFAGLLENLPLAVRRNMWFQMDGAPPHHARNVRNFLDVHFENRWIGRDGPIHWPARSPDLTPLDFFFWGRIKDLVYATPPVDDDDLLQRIINACQTVDQDMLSRVTNHVEHRARLCVQQEGGHFEHL